LPAATPTRISTSATLCFKRMAARLATSASAIQTAAIL
jgi:hypothetical protein